MTSQHCANGTHYSDDPPSNATRHSNCHATSDRRPTTPNTPPSRYNWDDDDTTRAFADRLMINAAPALTPQQQAAVDLYTETALTPEQAAELGRRWAARPR